MLSLLQVWRSRCSLHIAVHFLFLHVEQSIELLGSGHAILYSFKHINDILGESEKLLEERNSGSGKDRNKKLYFLPPSSLALPI